MTRRWLGKRQLAAANAAFVTEVSGALVELGATTDPALTALWHANTHRLSTRAGTLLVHVMPAISERGGWVACRFEDVAQARAVLGDAPQLNPYSGKYNLHLEGEAHGFAERLRAHLAPVLIISTKDTPA